MSAGRIASRYAKSLIELALENDKLDLILDNIEAFREALENRDLTLMLKSPIINSDKKIQILSLIFEEAMDPLSFEFIKVVVHKGREEYLPEIADAFVEQYKGIKQISTIYVTTALPLSDELTDRIQKILRESKVTHENIELIKKVDRDIIGGFIIEIEDKLYDASVKHKIESLKKEFSKELYAL